MLEKSNAALIEAIHAHTPQHSNPASLLMDMLNIGREAAYRRLRGEVPFTFGEASALCARMHFSLDRVVGLAATDKLSFQLKFKEFTALLETYNEILERDIAFMREVASDPTTEFAMATNSLPAEFYGKYDNLNRFKLFKWLYQHEVGNPAVRTFEELKLKGIIYSGKRLLDYIEDAVKMAYFLPDDDPTKDWYRDFMWYLWCGPKSPVYGKDNMATFENYFVADKAAAKENMNPYYKLCEKEEFCNKILKEFGLPIEGSHIINGHVPVKLKDGESPIKGNGKLFVIDGGLSKSYQPKTGIAGYTLIFNSHHLALAEHKPFDRNHENTPKVMIVEKMKKRVMVADTDTGKELAAKIADLKELVAVYRGGIIKEKLE